MVNSGRKIFLFILLLISSETLRSQWNEGLIQHFESNNLVLEFETYLRQQEKTSFDADSLSFYKLRLAVKKEDAQDVYRIATEHNQIRKFDSCFYDRLVLQLIVDQSFVRDSVFDIESEGETLILPPELIDMLKYVESEGREGMLFTGFEESYGEFMKYQHRTKWGAVWRSVLLPGWGRHYAGRKSTWQAGALVNFTFGAQLAESIILFGLSNPYTLVLAAGFHFFYFGEMIGSAKALELVRAEKKNQLLIDVANALLDRSPCKH